jgi:hypothetical protein
MIPREHGAYGQLLLPLLTAAAIGRPSPAGLALATAAFAAFVAHEPLLVVLGRRGERVRREEAGRAIRWLTLSAGIALVVGAIGVVWLPAADRWTLVVPLALAALAATWIARGRERTTSGEVVVGAALASASFPVAVASAATPAAALACVSAFVAGFTAATVSVRSIVGAHRHRGKSRAAAIGTIAGTVVGLAILALGHVVLPAAMWAAAPVCGVAFVLAVAAPSPRYLRQIGWTLVAATALTGFILVLAVR